MVSGTKAIISALADLTPTGLPDFVETSWRSSIPPGGEMLPLPLLPKNVITASSGTRVERRGATMYRVFRRKLPECPSMGDAWSTPV
jgi:hypothetical protein